MRGEKSGSRSYPHFSQGSPPHTRGKARKRVCQVFAPRITPAYAGKSLSPARSCPGPGHHPRIRGEKFYKVRDNCCAKGSPPHTRGKAGRDIACLSPFGITPAYAGKSHTSTAQHSALADHPRIRGEKLTGEEKSGIMMGSPPHTRGKDFFFYLSCRLERITPAYAGKRGRKTGKQKAAWDHPRIRGEKEIMSPSKIFVPGSPPHTRGKGLSYTRQFLKNRITPAYAGKSSE